MTLRLSGVYFRKRRNVFCGPCFPRPVCSGRDVAFSSFKIRATSTFNFEVGMNDTRA